MDIATTPTVGVPAPQPQPMLDPVASGSSQALDQMVQVSVPGDAQLTERIEDIIKAGNLETLTKKKVLQRLESEFLVALTHRKEWIYSEVIRIANEQHSTDDEEEVDEGPPIKKPRTRIKNPTGLQKPRTLSAKMALFTGSPKMPRTEVVKFICNYIREHNLQDPEDRRNIILDEKLRSVLGVDHMSYFSMQKLLSPHIEKDIHKSSNSDDTRERKKTGRGFHAIQILDDALADICGEHELSRCHVVKELWKYIKRENLQDPSDGRMIVCDKKFERLFKTKRIHMMTMNKELSKYLTPKGGDLTIHEPAPQVQNMTDVQMVVDQREVPPPPPPPPHRQLHPQGTFPSMLSTTPAQISNQIPVLSAPNTTEQLQTQATTSSLQSGGTSVSSPLTAQSTSPASNGVFSHSTSATPSINCVSADKNVELDVMMPTSHTI